MFSAAYCGGAVRQVHQIGPIVTNLSYFGYQGAKMGHKCVPKDVPKRAPSTTSYIRGVCQNIWVYDMCSEYEKAFKYHFSGHVSGAPGVAFCMRRPMNTCKSAIKKTLRKRRKMGAGSPKSWDHGKRSKFY